MSNRLYAAVLATFALLFLGNGIGLYNTFAWFRDLAPNGEVLPASFAWAISLIVLRMIVCAVSMGILVVAKGRRTALVASIAGVSTLLLIALVNAIPLLRVMRVADVRNFMAALTIAPADATATVRLSRLDPRSTGIVSTVELGRTPIIRHTLSPGPYRVSLIFEDGRFLELPVQVNGYDRDLRIEARLPPPARDVTQHMILLEGGPYAFQGLHSALLKLTGETVLAPFYMDKCEVTNGEYRSYLRDHPEARPRFWPDEGDYDPGFDDLPVTGITWKDAAGYAQWAGKRLPTFAEWMFAACGTEGRIVPWGNAPAADRSRGNVSVPIKSATRDPEGSEENGINPAWAEYVSHVRPACDAGVPGASNASRDGLVNLFGNVWEFTESMTVDEDDSHIIYEPTERWVVGGAWDAIARNSWIANPMQYGTRSLDWVNFIGFRCARSAEPARVTVESSKGSGDAKVRR